MDKLYRAKFFLVSLMSIFLVPWVLVSKLLKKNVKNRDNFMDPINFGVVIVHQMQKNTP